MKALVDTAIGFAKNGIIKNTDKTMKRIKGKRQLGILALGLALSINLFLGIHKSIVMDFIMGILYGSGLMLTLGRDIKKRLGLLKE